MGKRYVIKEYKSNEELHKDWKDIAFYTVFENQDFKYLALMIDREDFNAEKAIRSFVRFIRKNYYCETHKLVFGVNTQFCDRQYVVENRYIKVD